MIFQHLADNLDFDLAIYDISTHKVNNQTFSAPNITSFPIAGNPHKTDARIEDCKQ